MRHSGPPQAWVLRRMMDLRVTLRQVNINSPQNGLSTCYQPARTAINPCGCEFARSEYSVVVRLELDRNSQEGLVCRSRRRCHRQPAGHLCGGEDVTGARHDPPPHRYRICARGRLGQAIGSALPVLQARVSGAGRERCSVP